MTAQTILKMIEEVDSADTDKLDEIDARAYVFKSVRSAGNKFIKLTENGFIVQAPDGFQYEVVKKGLHDFGQYTRSRDALKAIRPEGYILDLCGTTAKLIKTDGSDVLFKAACQTEELAELHAIIQAIAHERGEG